MAQSAGFWSDLSAIKFNDQTNETWIQAMTLGDYEHPVHGKISLTQERIQRFADNVNNNVRTQQLDIDYEHKANGGEAAGWVKAAEARSNGLYLLVEWTAKAAQAIKEKAYKYFSPEFVDEWTHPKGGTFRDVLFGGGITNRPFLKDILPINMSEFFANAGQPPTNQEGKNMTPEQIKALAEQLGIDPASSSEVVHAKLVERLKTPVAPVKAAEDTTAADLKKLMDENPLVKALAEANEAHGKQLAEMSKRLRDQDIAVTVKTLSDKFATKGYAIPPAVLEDLTKALSESASVVLSETIVKAFTGIAESKIVELGERGSIRGQNSQNDANSALVRFTAEIKKLQDANPKLSYAAATTQVAAHNPMLFDEYRLESTVKE